jgi:hypothetical protein
MYYSPCSKRNPVPIQLAAARCHSRRPHADASAHARNDAHGGLGLFALAGTSGYGRSGSPGSFFAPPTTLYSPNSQLHLLVIGKAAAAAGLDIRKARLCPLVDSTVRIRPRYR